jgi:hypothetical protein
MRRCHVTIRETRDTKFAAIPHLAERIGAGGFDVDLPEEHEHQSPIQAA